MKYKLTEEIKEWCGHVLHRIECVEAFTDVESGEKGGWIEKEDNLSQDGDAWVCGNARVCGDAEVCGNARVYGNARVCDDARVYGDAEVYGNARVYGDAEVYGDAWVYGNAEVCGDAEVYGNARVYGDARVYGNARVAQGITTAMRIRTTEQFFEYQHTIAEMQKRWDAEVKEEIK